MNDIAATESRNAINVIDRAKPLRDALQKHDLWTPHQTAARRWPIGCVSLEVTQRCNLDCTLCYLSEHSEAVHDYPLEEIFRRIDLIADQYGPNTDVQVSGGDPTLRKREELVAIVAYIRAKGMRSSLFTNGILATRELLAELVAAGLSDVAFHVDLTQERKGYDTETSLNVVRDEYIERARGLGLSVFFNTTVYDANLSEVPMLARFFAERSDVVRLVSFQLQASTGRGTLGARDDIVSQHSVMRLIERGAATPLNFDALIGGHPSCNRYATAITVGRGASTRAHDLFRDGDFIARVMRETADVVIDRRSNVRAALSVVRAILMRPGLALAGIRALWRLLWRMKRDVPRVAQGVNKISYFLHNFMDASALEQERLDTCVFMAAGPDGPIPMCQFNAERDRHLLRSLKLKDGSMWNPLQGRTELGADALPLEPQAVARVYPIKFLKGRSREIASRARRADAQSKSATNMPAESVRGDPVSSAVVNAALTLTNVRGDPVSSTGVNAALTLTNVRGELVEP